MKSLLAHPGIRTLQRNRFAVLALALPLAGCIGTGDAATATSIDPQRVDLVMMDRQRGKLLYETHCIACHSTQVHWRDRSIVDTWDDLMTQVDRWQNNAGQQWGTNKITDVAAYLNTTFYRMPCSVPGCAPELNAAADR